MMAQFIHDGDAIDYTPASDVSAGDVVVQGELVGIAKRDIKAGELGALAMVGVFDFPKATGGGTAIAIGTKLFWDEAAREATPDSGGGANQRIGKSIAAATDDDETVRIRKG